MNRTETIAEIRHLARLLGIRVEDDILTLEDFSDAELLQELNSLKNRLSSDEN